jgi:hypothetical protein
MAMRMGDTTGSATPEPISMTEGLILLAQPEGGEPAIYKLQQRNAEPMLLYDGLPEELLIGLPGLVSTDGECLLSGDDWDWSESDTSCVLELITCSNGKVPLQNGISRATSSPDNRKWRS